MDDVKSKKFVQDLKFKTNIQEKEKYTEDFLEQTYRNL